MGFVFAPVSVLYFKGGEGSEILSLSTLYPYFQLCPVEFLREEREVGSCLCPPYFLCPFYFLREENEVGSCLFSSP